MSNSVKTKTVSPKEFAKARDSVRIVKETSGHKALEFRNKFSYNSSKVNNYSARFSKD